MFGCNCNLGIIYNGIPRYEVNAEILRTKIMPRYTQSEIDKIISPLPPSNTILCVRAPCPTDLFPPDTAEVIDMKKSNGQTVQVAVDENGVPIAAKEKPNFLPLALAASAAYFLLF